MFFFKSKTKNFKNSKLKILSGYNYRYRNVGKESEKTISNMPIILNLIMKLIKEAHLKDIFIG